MQRRLELERWPFGDLVPGRYSLLLVDPPWRFATFSDKGRGKSADKHYGCMTLADIQALPVGDLAAPDACLFMWATSPLLREGLETVKAWGFDYRTCGVWVKKTVHGKIAFGTGYRVRNATELFLLGFKGNPKNSRSHRNVIEGTIREHSRKPDSVYDWCSTYVDGPKCELFSRTNWPGFETWGNQAGLFNKEEAA